jgi:hypothetical protein
MSKEKAGHPRECPAFHRVFDLGQVEPSCFADRITIASTTRARSRQPRAIRDKDLAIAAHF